jgi:hypothetical protein
MNAIEPKLQAVRLGRRGEGHLQERRGREGKHNRPFVISVSIYPGTMAFTLIPDGPSSAARARVRPVFKRVSEWMDGYMRAGSSESHMKLLSRTKETGQDKRAEYRWMDRREENAYTYPKPQLYSPHTQHFLFRLSFLGVRIRWLYSLFLCVRFLVGDWLSCCWVFLAPRKVCLGTSGCIRKWKNGFVYHSPFSLLYLM